eukprot:scaffold15111_cov36-Phaeocystis_antarctica.AAC.1
MKPIGSKPVAGQRAMLDAVGASGGFVARSGDSCTGARMPRVGGPVDSGGASPIWRQEQPRGRTARWRGSIAQAWLRASAP